MKSLTMRQIILTLFFILKLLKNSDCRSILANGFCGYPGKPTESKFTPTKNIYNEGETIDYECKDFISLKQHRQCLKGKWTGLYAVCGYSYRNNDLKLARIFNKENENLIQEYNTTNLETFTTSANSFIADRYHEPLRAHGSKSYKIELFVNIKGMFQLVQISLSVVNHLIDERRKTKFNITRVTVSPYRECVLHSYSSLSPWLHNSTRFDYWFLCQSSDEHQFEEELKNKSNLVTIETESDNILDLDLTTFVLAEQYIKYGKPICGFPEIPAGLQGHFISSQTKYALKCKKGFRKLDDFSGDTHELVCGTDMKWRGSFPQCFPQKTCAKFELSDKNSVEVYLYDNVYYHNSSHWFAIEGTKAHFRCKNETSILVRKETRVCGPDGHWSDSLPNYLNTQNDSDSKLNWTTIFVTIIIISISLTTFLIYCCIKMKKKSQAKSSCSRPNTYEALDYSEFRQFDL